MLVKKRINRGATTHILQGAAARVLFAVVLLWGPVISPFTLYFHITLALLLLCTWTLGEYRGYINAKLLYAFLLGFIIFNGGARYLVIFWDNSLPALATAFVVYLFIFVLPKISFSFSQEIQDELFHPRNSLLKLFILLCGIFGANGYWVGKAIADGNGNWGLAAGFFLISLSFIVVHLQAFPIWAQKQQLHRSKL